MFLPHTPINQIKLLLVVSSDSHLRANSVSATKEVTQTMVQIEKIMINE